MVDVIIAIDPDVDKNGVALLNVKTKQLVVKTLTFAPTLDYVEVAHAKAKMQKQNFLVVVEGGWLNHSHWHINRERSRFHAAAIGNAVGRNHETGIHLCEVFKYKGIPLVKIHPTHTDAQKRAQTNVLQNVMENTRKHQT